MHTKIIFCHPDDLSLFPPVYCLKWSAIFQRTAVFYLYEHQITSITGNEIDLPLATAEILLQDLISFSF